ncbi:aflatoxin biosynthesis ketoreductase nor-1 [Lasiosphaeris hirsuta]|uniref:Aflatoxin biosynthesis ketoreductase nor-1 n=1 Tax=Lasiosphaeris hirsuta TaxID=260670 RepID=A0AA39ZRM4_9PEZI|nr:aflatoxin biosynthesis ketoreductase nor-1 [Lasiosphaeris hirsuta]
MTTTNVFITGVSRGIGKALAEAYLARPNHIVIGSVRDLSSPVATELQTEATKGEGSRLILVKIEATSETDYAAAVKHIEAVEGIDRLDIVVASAGVTGELTAVAGIDAADFKHVLDVNTVGPIRLFQATLPLLSKSANAKWVSLSTISSSIGGLEQTAAFPTVSYGSSKAAFNFITRAIHLQHKDIIAVAVHPGWVKTDMGNFSAKFFGLNEAFHEIGESVEATLKIVDAATKEETSGKFLGFDGAIVPW